MLEHGYRNSVCSPNSRLV